MLLRYIDVSGDARMVKLSPTSAAADGTSATLVIPEYANGAFTLQMFGSSSQPVLQIVPLLTRVDSAGAGLRGRGFVEGGSTYRFAGFTVSDTEVAQGADVYYDAFENGSASFDPATLPRHGLGSVTVSTAGGTSAALALKLLRPGSDTQATGALGDLAVDRTSGALWVIDMASPGHVLRIEAGTGRVLQTIDLPDHSANSRG